VGIARSAPNLHHWPIYSGVDARRTSDRLALLAQSHLLFDRASDRRVGGMLVGASYTLFKMRTTIGAGHGPRRFRLKKSASVHAATNRTERDLPAKAVFAGIAVVFVAMIVLYHFFISGAGNLSASTILTGSLVAAGVMIVGGILFAAVSGNLVGMIGSSNNPVSGLTLCTLVIAALLMVALGVSGTGGVCGPSSE